MSSTPATLDNVAAAIREMASGNEHLASAFEGLSQRMDEMLENWRAAANRTAAVLKEQEKLSAALTYLADRVTALEVKDRQRSRTKRLKEQQQ